MKIAMIELTSKCPRFCPTCLPKRLKSGRDLTWDEVRKLGRELKRSGFEGVTLAGFGEPARHPGIDKALYFFRQLKMRSQVVCRPENLALLDAADIPRVSVQTAGDAQKLFDEAAHLFHHPRIGAHIVLDNKAAFEIGRIFEVLEPWLGSRISSISVASPLALCDDEKHLGAIRKANNLSGPAWVAMRKLRERLPPKKAELVRLFEPDMPFAAKCAFFDGMIYIDSTLAVRPCCHQPLGALLGDLTKETVSQVLASRTWKNWQSTGRKSEACRRCPDLGAR